MTLYNDKFFNYVDAGASASAMEFVDILAPLLKPHSVLDVGCGRGGWLRAWEAAGCTRILGLDGDYVNRDSLKIPQASFRPQDLNTSFDLSETFDLVQSLEVAEHLYPTSSEQFVDSLTKHGDVILFSAAVPGQGGTSHINERHMHFWRQLFMQRGYEAYDFMRPQLTGLKHVEPWYRYNSMIYASPTGRNKLPDAIISSHVPASAPLVEGGSLGWKVRRAVVRALPRRAVNLLAGINAYTKR